MLKINYFLMLSVLGFIQTATIPAPQFVPLTPANRPINTNLPVTQKPNFPEFQDSNLKPINNKPINNFPGFVAFTTTAANQVPGFLDFNFPVYNNNNNKPGNNLEHFPAAELPLHPGHAEYLPEIPVNLPMPATGGTGN